MKKKSWVKEGEKNLPQVILNWTWKEQQETNLRDFSVNKNIIKNACEGVMTSPPRRGPALGEWQRKCGGEAQRKPVTWAFFEPSQLLCGNERRHQRKRREREEREIVASITSPGFKHDQICTSNRWGLLTSHYVCSLMRAEHSNDG